jgi:hypothetical protein
MAGTIHSLYRRESAVVMRAEEEEWFQEIVKKERVKSRLGWLEQSVFLKKRDSACFVAEQGKSCNN